MSKQRINGGAVGSTTACYAVGPGFDSQLGSGVFKGPKPTETLENPTQSQITLAVDSTLNTKKVLPIRTYLRLLNLHLTFVKKM